MELTFRHLFFLPTVYLLASSATPEAWTSRTTLAFEETAGTPKQERPGSSVPCAVPLRWRLADIDARFGLSGADAEAALRAAFAVWEGEVGGTFFVMEETGHPILFEYDQRQASAQRRGMDREAAAALAQQLGSRTAQLEDRLSLQRRTNAAVVEASAAHRERTRRLNDEISAWNQRRELPDSVRERLTSEQAALADAGRDLEQRQRALEEASEGLAAESRRLNREIDLYNRGQAATGSGSISQTQAGRYEEELTTRNGRVEDVRRRIQIYRYDSTRDLVIVLAHELGHALGLGHSDTQGAIMSEVSISDEREATPQLHARDVEMLDTTCPGLRSSAGGF